MNTAQEIEFKSILARDAYLNAQGYSEKGQEKTCPGWWPGAKFARNPNTGDKWYIDGMLIYKL